MKIGVACITYGRPKQLGRLIHCFEQQTYPHKELVVLDDGFQYRDQPRGPNWRVVSVQNRYRNLGEKRAACIDLLSPCDIVCPWDDDDLFLPHALDAIAEALKGALWSRSSEAYEFDGEKITRVKTYGVNPLNRMRSHHGGWAYRMYPYRAVGGYIGEDEDNSLQRRMAEKFGDADPICPKFPEPYYIYSREKDVSHISASYHAGGGFAEAWQNAEQKLEPAKLEVGFDRDYFAIPRPSVASPRPW